MSTITKLRKRTDGGLEHVVESIETPVQLAARTATMLANAKPTERMVVRRFLTPRSLDGKRGGDVKRIVVPAKPKREWAAPTPHFDAAQAARLAIEDELAKLLLELKDLD